ncbi:hypothetical protein D3C79_515790 [compost metagenome]
MKLKITNINIGLNTDGVAVPNDINEARITVLDWNEEKYTEEVLTDGKLMEMVIHSNIATLAGYDIKFDVEVLPDNHIILEKHTEQDWSYGLSADNYTDDINYLPCDMFKLEYPRSLEFDTSTDENISYLGADYEPTEEESLEQYLAYTVIICYLPIKVFARLQ